MPWPKRACTPSRISILTGQHVAHTLQGLSNGTAAVLRPDDITLGRVMHQAGYATAAIGKWTLSNTMKEPQKDTQEPWSQGFDFVAGNLVQGSNGKWARDYTLFDRDGSVTGTATPTAVRQPVEGKEKIYVDDMHVQQATKFIAAKAGKDKPFFLYIGLRAPHYPWEPPSLGEYETVDWPAPDTGNSDRQSDFRSYAATVTHMDHNVGELIDALKQHGVDQNTLVIFASDNGSTWSSSVFNPDAHGVGYFKSAVPFRGGKYDNKEGGIRGSGIAWWPGTIEAGSACAQPIGQYETLKTFADLAGVAPPPSSDGTSFLPELMGAPSSADRLVVVLGQWVQAGRYRASFTDSGAISSLVDLDAFPEQDAEVLKGKNLRGTLPELEARITAFAATEFAKRPRGQQKADSGDEEEGGGKERGGRRAKPAN
jgi:arylsulfatase A